MSVSLIPYSIRSSEVAVCISDRTDVGSAPLFPVLQEMTEPPLASLVEDCLSKVIVNRSQIEEILISSPRNRRSDQGCFLSSVEARFRSSKEP